MCGYVGSGGVPLGPAAAFWESQSGIATLEPGRHAAVVRARTSVVFAETVGPVATPRARARRCVVRMNRPMNAVAADIGVVVIRPRAGGE